MKYAVAIGSGAMIYIPSLRKIGSGIQKLMGGGGDSQTHRQYGYRKSTLFFRINKVSKELKISTFSRCYIHLCSTTVGSWRGPAANLLN
jgi:hypothetical protein